MKKLLLSILLMISAILLNAGVIEKTYSFNSHEIKQLGEYQLIKIDGSMNTGIVGEPALPYFTVQLLLPPGEVATSIEFTGKNNIQLPGTFYLYPQQPSRPLSDQSKREFSKNEMIYSKDANYPAKQTGNLSTSFMNGYAFAISSFTPVVYNPVTGEISISQQVKIKITTTPNVKAAQALNNLKSNTLIKKRIQQFAQNASVFSQYQPSDTKNDDYQLLIITPSQFEENFNELKETYLIRGIKSELVTKESINASGTGQDLQEKIRNYIIEEYQNSSIEFVLLGGDVEHIPHRGFYCYVQSGSGYEDDDIPADMYYSALDGTWNDDGDGKWGEIGEDDLLPEVAVGRFSFSNASELSNMLNKTLMYQNEPVLGEFNNALMAGEWLYNNPDTYGSDYLELLIGYQNENGYETWGIPEDYNYQKLYEINQSWSANDLISAINSGKQYVHHVGHANSNYVAYMYNSDITNSNFYGANGVDHNFTIMQSAGCICGAFDDSDCIMEKMVSIENFAVAVVGNSRYGWFNEGQTEGPAQHLHREMVDAMYHEKLNHIGQAFVESKIQTAPWVTAPGQWEEGALRWNFYDINILGDPTLSLWTDEPITLETSYQNTLSIGTPSMDVTVNSEGSPVENLRCSFLKDGILYGVGISDVSGEAQIYFDEELTTLGDAELIISGYNCLPQVYTVTIIPNEGAYVVYASNEIDDSQGNGNGFVDFGESISLTIELENAGTELAENVEVTLSTTNSFITITDGVASFGNISGGTFTTLTNAFTFDVASNIPDQQVIDFDMEITAGDTWTSSFQVIANAPELVIGALSINDNEFGNGDGILDPGETADIYISTSNIGNCGCDNAESIISSISEEITITIATCNLGLLDAGETQMAVFTVEVDEEATIGTNVDLTAELIAGEYMAQKVFILSIGMVFEDFESENFNSFGWEFGGNADWTICNQNPFEGDYCAQSGNINDQQESELILAMDVMADDEISFFRKVSSEGDYDYLRFYIDNNLIEEWAGEEGWEEVSYPVTEGSHIFKWAYEKDASVSYGEDCAWIDYIIFPAATGTGNVLSMNITASPPEICYGEISQLNGYVFGGSGNYVYLWSPESGLSDPTIPNPIATPEVTTNYSLTVNDGSSSVTEAITITVDPVPETPEITLDDNHLVSSSATGNQWYNAGGPISGANGQTYYPITSGSYYVVVSNEFGCDSEFSNIINFIYTGIEKIAANQFKIYPNPCIDHFTVEFNLDVKSDITICLFNKLGQKAGILMDKTNQHPGFYQLEFSKPGLDQGIYYIKIETNGFNLTKKIIIQ